MKITKRLITYTAMQAVFCAVVPAVFIFVEYGGQSGGTAYKLPLGALLVLLVVVVVAKNTLLKPRLNRLSVQIAQHDADLKVEAGADKIQNLEAELKRERTLETFFNAVIPMLVFAALLVACKAMEKAVLQLSGAVGFSLASFAVGTVFGVLAAREVKGKHGGEK